MPFNAADKTHRFEVTSMDPGESFMDPGEESWMDPEGSSMDPEESWVDPGEWKGVVFPPISSNIPSATPSPTGQAGNARAPHASPEAGQVPLYTPTQYTATYGVTPWDDLEVRYLGGTEVARFNVPDPAPRYGPTSGVRGSGGRAIALMPQFEEGGIMLPW